jgi:peptidoglycan/LPS O-acetylase OafA/YrhL
MKHRPEIDGLRTFGIIPLMLFHAGFNSFSGGYVSVDIFFVISGYLISTIILEEINRGNFSIINFYERRLRRILPALFLVIITTLIAGFILLSPVDYKSLGESVMAVTTFTSNIYFWKTSDYFDPHSELKPLLNTWSLAVEEQFYIIFPVLLILIIKMAKEKLLPILFALTMIGCIFSYWGSSHFPIFSFYLLPTRFYELMIGAICAVMSLEQKKLYLFMLSNNSFISVIGFSLIAYSIIFFDGTIPFPSLYALIPTIGTALLILCCTDSNFLGSILKYKFFVTIGLISYSTFLWFQPIFAFARIINGEEPNNFVFLLLSLLSLVVGWISWKFIETPLRNKNIYSRKFIFLTSLITSLTLFTIGLGLFKTNGLENFYINHRLSPEELVQHELSKKFTGKDLYQQMHDDFICKFWTKSINDHFIERFDKCSQKNGPAIVVLGDSHAMNLYNILAKTGQYKFIVGISQGGCRPYDNLDYCNYDVIRKFIFKHNDHIENIFYNQSGTLLLSDVNGKSNVGKLFHQNLPVTINEISINHLLDYLSTLSTSDKITLVGPFLEPQDALKPIRLFNSGSNKFNQKLIYEFKKLDQYLNYSAEKFSIRYISLLNLFDQEKYGLANKECILYNDSDHFSACGEEIFSERLKSNKQNLF